MLSPGHTTPWQQEPAGQTVSQRILIRASPRANRPVIIRIPALIRGKDDAD